MNDILRPGGSGGTVSKPKRKSKQENLLDVAENNDIMRPPKAFQPKEITFYSEPGKMREEHIAPGPNVAGAGASQRNLLFGTSGGEFKAGFRNDGTPFILNPLDPEHSYSPHDFFKWLANAQLFSGQGGVVDPSQGLLTGVDWAQGRTGVEDFDKWMQPSQDILRDRVGQDWNIADRAAESDMFRTNAGIMQLANMQNAPYFDPVSGTSMGAGIEETYARMGPEAALGWQALANNQALDAFNAFGGNNLLAGIQASDLDRLIGGGQGSISVGGGAPQWADRVLNQGTPRLDAMFDEMDRRRDQSISSGTQKIAQDAARLGFRGGFAQGKGADVIREAITRNEGEQAQIPAQMENELQNRYASALNAEGAAGAQVASSAASSAASMHNALVGARTGILGDLIGERGAAARAAQGAVYDRVNQGLLLGHDSLEGSRERLANLFGNRLGALDQRYMSDMDRHANLLTSAEDLRLRGLAGQDAARSQAFQEMQQLFGNRDALERQRMMDYVTMDEQLRAINQARLDGMFELASIPFRTEQQIATGTATGPVFQPRGTGNNWMQALPAIAQLGGQVLGGPSYEQI